MENLILVGFGNMRLVNLIEKINTDQEDELINLALGGKIPPVYRSEESCSDEEKLAFIEFVGFLNNILEQFNNQEKQEIS